MVESQAGLLSGEAEAVVIVKAVPQVGKRHGETVCCAGIDLKGQWLRLYPVAFRVLEDAQKFARWDQIRFKCRIPNDDSRSESRRVDHQSIQIIGHLKQKARETLLTKAIVTGLDGERQKGRSLALLKAKVLSFWYEKKSAQELVKEIGNFKSLRSQADLFTSKSLIPYEPCHYKFKYRYETDDGHREGTCQDWETEATFFNWRRMYGEERALNDIKRIFGEEYPSKGMLLAMGTHSRYPDTWLINGVIRLDEIGQFELF